MGLFDKLNSFLGGKNEEPQAGKTMAEMGLVKETVAPRPMTPEQYQMLGRAIIKDLQIEPQIAQPAPSRGYDLSLVPVDKSPDPARELRKEHDAHYHLEQAAERNAPAKDAPRATLNTQQQPPPLSPDERLAAACKADTKAEVAIKPEHRRMMEQLRSEIQIANIGQSRQRDLDRGHEPLL